MSDRKTLLNAAACSLLFGGTLGSAHAGMVSATPGGTSYSLLSLAYVYDSTNYSLTTYQTSGAPANGAVSLSAPGFGSISCSRFLSTGFSAVINANSNCNLVNCTVEQAFTVTGTVNYSLSGWSTGFGFAGFQARPGEPMFVLASGAFNLSGTLQAGTYSFMYQMDSSPIGHGGFNTTLFNLTFSDAVPAPSALALLVLGGVRPRRRRS